MIDKISKINAQHEYVTDFGSFIVGVDKIGGGTLGKGYDGDWTATLYTPDGDELEVVPVRTGMPYLHQAVAELIYQDMTEEW